MNADRVLLQKAQNNLDKYKCKTYTWPTREVLEQISHSARPVKLKKLTLRYTDEIFQHKRLVDQLKKGGDEAANLSNIEQRLKAIQSIQVHLSNGMSSPVIPYSKPDNDGGVEDILQDFHCEHVKSISFRTTKMGQFKSITSFAVTYSRKGDAKDTYFTDQS